MTPDSVRRLAVLHPPLPRASLERFRSQLPKPGRQRVGSASTKSEGRKMRKLSSSRCHNINIHIDIDYGVGGGAALASLTSLTSLTYKTSVSTATGDLSRRGRLCQHTTAHVWMMRPPACSSHLPLMTSIHGNTPPSKKKTKSRTLKYLEQKRFTDRSTTPVTDKLLARRSSNHHVNHKIDRSLNRPTNQPRKPTNQTINQLINQPINHPYPINQPNPTNQQTSNQ